MTGKTDIIAATIRLRHAFETAGLKPPDALVWYDQSDHASVGETAIAGIAIQHVPIIMDIRSWYAADCPSNVLVRPE